MTERACIGRHPLASAACSEIMCRECVERACGASGTGARQSPQLNSLVRRREPSTSRLTGRTARRSESSSSRRTGRRVERPSRHERYTLVVAEVLCSLTALVLVTFAASPSWLELVQPAVAVCDGQGAGGDEPGIVPRSLFFGFIFFAGALLNCREFLNIPVM